MSDFKAKLHKVRFPLGELTVTALPRLVAGFKGPRLLLRGGMGKRQGREGVGDKKGEEG